MANSNQKPDMKEWRSIAKETIRKNRVVFDRLEEV